VAPWSKKGGYEIFRCAECRLKFVFPIPEKLESIYGKKYFLKEGTEKAFGYVDYDRDKDPMRGIFEKYLFRVGSLTDFRKVFDVGAATGYFLDIAKKNGWKTAGTEISAFAAAEAQKRGHDVRQEELFLVRTEEKFSLVTMWDVIEHVRSPREYLVAANRLLSDGGYLIINTPDAESVFAKILGKRWHLLVPPEHLYYFSPRNMAALLSDAGFEVVSIEKIGKKFSLTYIFRTLHQWQGLEIWRKSSLFFDTAFWRRIPIPLNLRDNMLIVAKKRQNR
jgi:SAM-dependent methyltransferase